MILSASVPVSLLNCFDCDGDAAVSDAQHHFASHVLDDNDHHNDRVEVDEDVCDNDALPRLFLWSFKLLKNGKSTSVWPLRFSAYLLLTQQPNVSIFSLSPSLLGNFCSIFPAHFPQFRGMHVRYGICKLLPSTFVESYNNFYDLPTFKVIFYPISFFDFLLTLFPKSFTYNFFMFCSILIIFSQFFAVFYRDRKCSASCETTFSIQQQFWKKKKKQVLFLKCHTRRTLIKWIKLFNL